MGVSSSRAKARVAFLLGPTAAGKSELALEMAGRAGGEIVNCDSLQVYQGLDIGTAKPTAQDLKSVPHHLYGIVPIGGSYSAGQYRREALQIIEKAHGPLVFVGGSGFYVKALQEPMYETKTVSQEVKDRWERRMKEEGPAQLHGELVQMDPAYAGRINPMDRYRIFRALTLMEAEGRSMSDIQEEWRSKKSSHQHPWEPLNLGIAWNRETLRRRVAERVNGMLQQGFIDEVRTLLAAGYESWPPLTSVGYREVVAHLKGELSEWALKERIIISTMQLAKKQMTWFRGMKMFRWFQMPEERNQLVESFLDLAQPNGENSF